MEKELNHVVSAVEAAELRVDPYEHFNIGNFFSEEFYQRMLDDLPSDDQYFHFQHKDLKSKGLYGSDSPRLRIDFIDRDPYFSDLPKESCWWELRDILCSEELKGALFEKFKRTVRNESCESIPCLMRDREGYFIKPHTDTRSKIITLLMYLHQMSVVSRHCNV